MGQDRTGHSLLEMISKLGLSLSAMPAKREPGHLAVIMSTGSKCTGYGF